MNRVLSKELKQTRFALDAHERALRCAIVQDARPGMSKAYHVAAARVQKLLVAKIKTLKIKLATLEGSLTFL